MSGRKLEDGNGNTALAKKGGFSDKVSNASDNRFNYELAIPIEDVTYEKIPVSDYWENKILPPLPVGFYIKDKETGIKERMTSYTFKTDVLNTGKAELFLDKAEEKTRDGKAIVNKLSSFLAKTIDTIGGYPLQEIVERYGNTAEVIFQRAWLADIFTMYIGAKLLISGMPFAITGFQCPCFRREIISDNGEDRPLHNLGDIEIKYFTNLEDKEPLFKVDLPDGFNDGRGDVKSFYCVPLKLNDIAAFMDSKSQESQKIRSFQRMIVGIPESETYGLKRNNIFGEEIFTLLTRSDRRHIERTIVPNLQPGPINKMPVTCHNCMEAPKLTYQLPWMNQTSFFLFASDLPDIQDVD